MQMIQTSILGVILTQMGFFEALGVILFTAIGALFLYGLFYLLYGPKTTKEDRESIRNYKKLQFLDPLEKKHNDHIPQIDINSITTNEQTKIKAARLLVSVSKKNLAENNFHRAIESSNYAIMLLPECVEAYINRGIAKSNLQDYSGGLQDYDIAIKFDPDSSLAFNNRGNTYAAMERNEEALLDYNKAISIDPKFSNAYLARGVVKFKLGRFDEGLLDVRKAHDLGNEAASKMLKEIE